MTALAGRRVLVVEDSWLLAMEAKAALEDAGAAVVGPFGDAVAAALSLTKGRPDCAVLDVDLGEGTSLALARMLRSEGIPFLFVTGFDRAALPPEFVDVERLEKPVDMVRLLRAIARCCRPGPS